MHGQLNPAVPSQVWIDGHELLPGHPWPGRSDHGITLQIRRLVVPLEPPVAGRIAVDILQTQFGPQRPAVNEGNNDADHFHAMQYNVESLTSHEPVSNSDTIIPDGNHKDLQRVVQHHTGRNHIFGSHLAS